MTTLLESLNSDESKSIPPECLSIGNVLILKSPSKLNTYRLPHQSPIGSINLSESVQCMTAIESQGFIILLLGDAEGSITFLTEFCVPYKSQRFTSESTPILKMKPSPIRKGEILAVSAGFVLLLPALGPGQSDKEEDIPYTKLLPPPHDIRDALILLPRPKCLFDALHEGCNKTEGPLIITAGNGLLLQKHSFPSSISEWDLAKNVVSSVKSGFFRVFGGSSDKESKKMETEKRIEKVMGIKDAKKRVLSLEASPDGRFTVALDLQHRVELFDNDYGRLLHVWKGYHHARTAWIFSQETEKDPSVLLLAIYSPRRKKIEIWSPVNKARITEFPVEDPGTFLKSKDDSKFINLVTGDIFSFVVPFSSVHDPLQGIDKFKRTLHKFYRLRPQDEDAEKYLKELLYLIRSAGSQHQQCSLLLELCQSANVSTKQGLFACNSLKGESQGDIISAFIEKLLAIIDLKVHLESIEAQREAFEGSLDEFIVDNFPGNEVAEFSTDIHLSSSVPIEAISFGKFMSFVEINRFCLPEFRSLNGPNLLPFTFHIASGFLETHMQETKRLLSLACPDLDLSRIFFASATQGSLSMDNMGMFAPLLKNFWGYVSQKFETHRLSAKNFFYHSLMNESNLGIMKLWIGFVGEGAEPNEDLLRVSGLVRTYLLLRKNFLQIAQSSVLKDNTFDEVFNKGNGMLPTVIVSWFVESELRLEVAEEFRSNNEFLFPHSLCSDTFYVHFAFSLFAFQSSALVKNPLSFKDIKSILTDKIQTPVLKHRLSAVLWNNFAKGYVRTLLELFKGPSFKDSAHREVGIREDFMSEFFEFLHFIKTFDLYHWEVVEERVDNLIKYDDVSLVEQPFVGDVINGFSRTEEYEYSAGIYFQAIIIIQFMWQFRIEVNPLSLFKPRDLDEIIFLQEEKQHQSSRGMSLGFGGLLSGLGGDIKRHRNAFLEKTSFRLVDLIESGEGDALRREEFDSWATKYYTISGYWNLRSKSKRYVMRDLYKAGYDAAGREMFEPSSFEQDELHELKSIACLRLAKILSQASPSTTAIVNSVKPELIQKLAYCEVFTKDLVDVPIRKTRDLFSLICSVDEDPEMLDYLSIVRSIQDAELE